MVVKMMIQPPLKAMDALLADSRRLIAEGRPRVAVGTLHCADFFLQCARFADSPCGAEYADLKEAEIAELRRQAEGMITALPPDDTDETA